MSAYRLVNAAPDGDYVTDGPFGTIADAWEFCENMGSRWFFYPIPFVAEADTLEIVEADDVFPLNLLVGKLASELKENADVLADAWELMH